MGQAADIVPTNLDNPWAEILRQIIELQRRLDKLERQMMALATEKANPSAAIGTFAAAPPATQGEIRFFTDRTAPAVVGPKFPGVLAVWDGISRWLTLGEDVSTF